MKRLLMTLAAVVVLAVGGVASGPPVTPPVLAGTAAAQASQSASVTIQNMAFSPATLNVQPGTSVTWTNKDTVAHTVTADSGSGPMSSQLQPGQTYSFTYSTAGTFAYHCSIHPFMKASIVVGASSSTPPQNTQNNQSSGSASSTNQQSQSGASSSTSGGMGGQSSSGAVATGPVETGSGTTSSLQYVPVFVAGSLALLAGLALPLRALTSRTGRRLLWRL